MSINLNNGPLPYRVVERKWLIPRVIKVQYLMKGDTFKECGEENRDYSPELVKDVRIEDGDMVIVSIRGSLECTFWTDDKIILCSRPGQPIKPTTDEEA